MEVRNAEFDEFGVPECRGVVVNGFYNHFCTAVAKVIGKLEVARTERTFGTSEVEAAQGSATDRGMGVKMKPTGRMS